MAYLATGGCSVIHELDENGEQIHVDIDPFIPTGVCAICTERDQETEPPEKRQHHDELQ